MPENENKEQPPSWSKDAVVETRINLVRVPSETIRQCHFDNHPCTTLLSLKKLFTLISSIVPFIHSTMYTGWLVNRILPPSQYPKCRGTSHTNGCPHT